MAEEPLVPCQTWPCCWCRIRPATRGWACERCYLLKEEAYRQSHELGEITYAAVLERALDATEEKKGTA